MSGMVKSREIPVRVIVPVLNFRSGGAIARSLEIILHCRAFVVRCTDPDRARDEGCLGNDLHNFPDKVPSVH